MKRFFYRVSCFSLACLLCQSAHAEPSQKASTSPFAGKTIETLDGDDVLKLVRYSYTKINRSFKGQLRHDKKKIPFVLSLKPQSIVFEFSSPQQVIQLSTADDKLSLKEKFGDKEKFEGVKPEWYRTRIRGTDVTFDDISMRFLYWPKAKIEAEEKISRRNAWKVLVKNPTGEGDYGYVHVWVDKGSGAMLKMIGYEPFKGKPIKEFEVKHVKNMGGILMIDHMLIKTLDPKTGRRSSYTNLDILDVVGE